MEGSYAMSIDFSPERWQKLKAHYRAWWKGELERPIVAVTVRDRDPGRPKPDVPLLTQATCADLSIPVDQVIDRIDYELSSFHYLGDAYPFFSLGIFGPGVVAAFLGARLDNSSGNVWYHPGKDLPLSAYHFRFDPDNVWFRRIRELYVAGMKRWQGQVLMGMTDLGGAVDIVSTFRPGEKLLLDLYDCPDEVKRVTWEIHAAWHQYYQALNEVLQPVNPGYSDWAGIYSEETGYMFQCDVAYMLGPQMFEEFVRPELAASFARVSHAFYHLDGIGQIPHLDSLVKLPALKGIQWVPGAGQPSSAHWPEVFRKISAGGKRMQLRDWRFSSLETVINQIGTPRGIQMSIAGAKDGPDLRRHLARFGVE
jgi:5-methyltetrahydrofolate--homocysteine methyltransferase